MAKKAKEMFLNGLGGLGEVFKCVIARTAKGKVIKDESGKTKYSCKGIRGGKEGTVQRLDPNARVVAMPVKRKLSNKPKAKAARARFTAAATKCKSTLTQERNAKGKLVYAGWSSCMKDNLEAKKKSYNPLRTTAASSAQAKQYKAKARRKKAKAKKAAE